MITFNKNNFNRLQFLIAMFFIIIIIMTIFLVLNKNMNSIVIEDNNIKSKYNNLVKILGKPNNIEIDNNNRLITASWISPLDNFHDFGKYGGCDLIKIHGYPSKKFHPYPAQVFLIVGKYIKVPDNLLGPLKYASETINIEQLFVPSIYASKYMETGIKDVALVTGSCASVTISAITVQFVIDMIEKYKNNKNCNKLYKIFRKEYDRRIKDYLCGKGITNKINWFDPKYFDEDLIYNIGEDKCKKKVIENYHGGSHRHSSKSNYSINTEEQVYDYFGNTISDSENFINPREKFSHKNN